MIRILFVLLAIPAWSQALEMAVGGGQSRLSNTDLGGATADNYSLKGGFRVVMRMTFNSGDFKGHETGYAYNRTQLVTNGGDGTATQQGMAIHQGFYNYLLYPTREGTRIRPFATGGVHFANYVPPGASATSGGGSTKFGVNYGGGLKIRVSERFMLRFDARQYTNPKPFGLSNSRGWIRMNEYSASLAFVL